MLKKDIIKTIERKNNIFYVGQEVTVVKFIKEDCLGIIDTEYFYSVELDKKGTLVLNASNTNVYMFRFDSNTHIETHREVVEVPNEGKEVKRKDRKVVDHINHLVLDNRFENLRIVTTEQNNLNSRSRLLRVKVTKDGKFFVNKRKDIMFETEEEALKSARLLEIGYGSNTTYYPEEDFSTNPEISVRVLSGEISYEQAEKERLLELSRNAWVCVRFCLEEKLRESGIPMPAYKLDADGYICDLEDGRFDSENWR